MKEIIKFECLYKLFCTALVLPLLSLLTGWFMKYVIQDSIVYNFDIFFRLLTIPGMIFILIYAFIFLSLVYLEYVSIYKMAYLCQHQQPFNWRSIFYSGFHELKAFKTPSVLFIFIYFILLNPLWHLGFVSSMIPRVSIPNFITNEILKMNMGSVLALSLYLILFILYAFLIFVPFYMIYSQTSFLKSCKLSIRTMLHQRKIWFILIGIFIVYYLLENYVFPHYFLNVSDFNFYFLRYFVLSSTFRMRTFLFIGFSVLWTVVEIGFIFFQIKSVKDVDVNCIFEQTYKSHKIDVKTRIKRHKLAASIISCCSLGAFILFYFNQEPLLHLPYAIGHRGDISQVENSLEGILAADANGADFAEIDIQITKDKILVLCHDTNLKRLTGKDINLQDCTLEELKELTIQDHYGHQAKIPTLEEAIQTAKNAPNQIGLLIEFKPLEGDREETIRQTIELIERYDFADKAMFMSMDVQSVEMLAKERDDWWIGYCAFGNFGRIQIRLNDPFIPDFIAIEESAINTQLLEDARNNVLPVYVWTVDDIDAIQDYLNMGISGIIGDASDQVAYGVHQFKAQVNTDDEHYKTTCFGFPQLTKDEYDYVQCER